MRKKKTMDRYCIIVDTWQEILLVGGVEQIPTNIAFHFGLKLKLSSNNFINKCGYLFGPWAVSQRTTKFSLCSSSF